MSPADEINLCPGLVRRGGAWRHGDRDGNLPRISRQQIQDITQGIDGHNRAILRKGLDRENNRDRRALRLVLKATVYGQPVRSDFHVRRLDRNARDIPQVILGNALLETPRESHCHQGDTQTSRARAQK